MRHAITRLRRSAGGVSLIEILIGIVIVTLASIATMQYFAYARGGIGRQAHRRAALERARQRLEETLSVNLTSIQPPANNAFYWLTCGGAPVACGPPVAAPVTQNVSVDNLPAQPMETRVQCLHDPAATTSVTNCDTVAIEVRVWFTNNTGADDNFNRVYVRTLRTS